MMSTSTQQRNDVPVSDDASSAQWAAEAQAKITALYHQVEARDPNDADMVSRTQQLIAECKSTFQIVLTASGVNAIEANEKRVSIRMFPTRMSARKWVLERLDHLATLEHAAIRDRMFAL